MFTSVLRSMISDQISLQESFREADLGLETIADLDMEPDNLILFSTALMSLILISESGISAHLLSRFLKHPVYQDKARAHTVMFCDQTVAELEQLNQIADSILSYQQGVDPQVLLQNSLLQQLYFKLKTYPVYEEYRHSRYFEAAFSEHHQEVLALAIAAIEFCPDNPDERQPFYIPKPL